MVYTFKVGNEGMITFNLKIPDKITLFLLNIVIVKFQHCDETDDDMKYFCGTFIDYTFLKLAMQK